MSLSKNLMPDHITGWTRVVVWLNLIVNIGIVATGGLVRLTGSGLGCPTWPMCTNESLVTTPEMGIHGIIEFGNRLLTFVLVIVALLAFLAVLNTRHSRLRLVGPSVWIGVLIIVQALVGGLTVLVELDPRIVGIHFLFSALIVSIAGLLVQRVRLGQPIPENAPAPNGAVWVSAIAVAVLTWISEIMGVLTTGAGPHAGDSIAARNGLDPAVMQHVHAWPGYALVVALVVFIVLSLRGGFPRTSRAAIGLAVVVVVQIAFGVFQARTGLPIWSVIIHMVLAVVTLAVLSATLVNARRETIAGKRSADPSSTVHEPVVS